MNILFFLKDKLSQINTTNKFIALVLVIVLFFGFIWFLIFYLIEVINSFFNLNLTTKVSKITTRDDPVQEKIEQDKKYYQEIEENFQKANIPYYDPRGRFSIQFLTPFYSGKLVVYIQSNENREQVMSEVNNILKNAEKHVNIESVTYVDVTKER